MTLVAQRRPQTEADFLRLQNGADYKWEWVGGKAVRVPTKFDHDPIGVNLIYLLMPLIRGKGVMTSGQSGFRMRNGNVRCPDVSFTRKERIPGGRPTSDFGTVAPDLCVEIISPSEDAPEMQAKVDEYFAAGAQLVWHLFPESQQVRFFTAPTVSTLRDADDELNGGDLLPDFRVLVRDLFDVGLDCWIEGKANARCLDIFFM